MTRRIESQADQWPWPQHKQAWGTKKVDSPPLRDKDPDPIQNDAVRLIQPEESGLEYPAIVKHRPEHGDKAYDVLKILDG